MFHLSTLGFGCRENSGIKILSYFSSWQTSWSETWSVWVGRARGWEKLCHSYAGHSSSFAKHHAWAGAEASEAFPEVQNFVVKYVYSLMWWTGERLWKIISFYCRRKSSLQEIGFQGRKAEKISQQFSLTLLDNLWTFLANNSVKAEVKKQLKYLKNWERLSLQTFHPSSCQRLSLLRKLFSHRTERAQNLIWAVKYHECGN